MNSFSIIQVDRVDGLPGEFYKARFIPGDGNLGTSPENYGIVDYLAEVIYILRTNGSDTDLSGLSGRSPYLEMQIGRPAPDNEFGNAVFLEFDGGFSSDYKSFTAGNTQFRLTKAPDYTVPFALPEIAASFVGDEFNGILMNNV